MVYGVLYVTATYVKKKQLERCPKVKYVYRPSVRTFTEEQEQPVSVYGLYKNMFWKFGPFSSTFHQSAQLNLGGIQPYSWAGLPKNEMIGNRNPDDWKNDFFG